MSSEDIIPLLDFYKNANESDTHTIFVNASRAVYAISRFSEIELDKKNTALATDPE